MTATEIRAEIDRLTAIRAACELSDSERLCGAMIADLQDDLFALENPEDFS